MMDATKSVKVIAIGTDHRARDSTALTRIPRAPDHQFHEPQIINDDSITVLHPTTCQQPCKIMLMPFLGQ